MAGHSHPVADLEGGHFRAGCPIVVLAHRDAAVKSRKAAIRASQSSILDTPALGGAPCCVVCRETRSWRDEVRSGLCIPGLSELRWRRISLDDERESDLTSGQHFPIASYVLHLI